MLRGSPDDIHEKRLPVGIKIRKLRMQLRLLLESKRPSTYEIG
jgi:hypothetical protein